MKTIAEKVLAKLKTIVANDSLEVKTKYNKCLAFIEKNASVSLRLDRVVTYNFKDESSLVEYNEEDYGGSVVWYILDEDDEYEDTVEILFNDYDYDYEDEDEE